MMCGSDGYKGGNARTFHLTYLLVIAAIFLTIRIAQAEPLPTPQLYEAVRTLQKLQDAIAQGNMSARAVQEKLIAQTARQFREAPAGTWQEHRNVRAAIVFVLSGGPPDSIEALLKLPDLSEENKKLLEGAIAFANGQKGKAAELLGEVDPRALPRGLGGHVALVQSMLTSADDKKAMLHSLDLARHLMPGTLIEESALRRAIGVAAEMQDMTLVDKLTGVYLRRFAASLYAQYFSRQFAGTLARSDDKIGTERLARLGDVLEKLPPAFQASFNLSIAGTAANQGKTALAAAAAAAADRLTPEGSPEKQRSQLYQAASMIVSGQYDQGVERLKAVDENKLGPEDKTLRQSALTVAQAIRESPKPSQRRPNAEAGQSEEAAAESKAISDLVARARKELGAAQKAEEQGLK